MPVPCPPVTPRPTFPGGFVPRPTNSPTRSAIMTWKDAVNANEIDTSTDIPSACLDNDYDVELKTTDGDGAHFVLTASVSPGENTSDNEICPKLLAFASIDEKKRVYSVPDIAMLVGHSYSSYYFGKASLKAIFDAESSVEAVKDSKYNLTSNSCAHYAQKIWRGLHFDETNELASFLVDNLLKEDGLLTVAGDKLSAGGLRVMSYYAAGKGSFSDFVKDTVYSQLIIKDNKEKASIGKTCHLISLYFSDCSLILFYCLFNWAEVIA